MADKYSEYCLRRLEEKNEAERLAKLTPSETPESDEANYLVDDGNHIHDVVTSNFARKLEKERNQTIATLKLIRIAINGILNKYE